MTCACPNAGHGRSYSLIDRKAGTVSGYVTCSCGKEKRRVYTQPYRPQASPNAERLA